jgi:hypothetical protein
MATVSPFSLSFSSNLDDANGLVLLLLLVIVLSSPRLLLLCPISGSQCKERAERGLSMRRLRLTEGEVLVSDEVLREERSAADDDDILDGLSVRAELNVRGKAMATGSRLPLLPFASLALALALALALVRWDG